MPQTAPENPATSLSPWHRSIWLAVAVIATVVFLSPKLDLRAAQLFFDNTSRANHWPVGKWAVFRFLYVLVPWLTAAFLVGAGLLLANGWRTKRREMQKAAVFLFLCMLLGPGLLVNGVLKEYAGRPRPRALVEFGGSERYLAPWHFGTDGHSFPCGHCSVAFTYAALCPVLQRRRPKLSKWILALAVTGGLAIGVGRMAAGAHFLSDVVWAGLIVWAVILALQKAMRAEPLSPEKHQSSEAPTTSR